MVNGQIALRVPLDVIKTKCSPCLAHGKPAKQPALMNSDDHAIVATFGTVYRGIIQYYLLAGDVYRLRRRRWVMETSMLKSLAGKHRSTVSKMAAKYKTAFETPSGPRIAFEARIEPNDRKPLVARFGGIPLQRQRAAELADREPVRVDYPQKELVARLLADSCEICGSKGNVQVHHVRALADADLGCACQRFRSSGFIGGCARRRWSGHDDRKEPGVRQEWEPEDLIAVWTLLEEDQERLRNKSAGWGSRCC
ncbi:group II intron reverse transcriptase/maturase [Streptomyces scopuliridis]|uniref:group II intron reverse transcriptase/maturase n=1 Tax=Streptomyces scopuliridis TaxID=452529 RepID=UPI003697CBF2